MILIHKYSQTYNLKLRAEGGGGASSAQTARSIGLYLTLGSFTLTPRHTIGETTNQNKQQADEAKLVEDETRSLHTTCSSSSVCPDRPQTVKKNSSPRSPSSRVGPPPPAGGFPPCWCPPLASETSQGSRQQKICPFWENR